MSLTDSHHNHHGQKPTMVGICHGGNVLGNRDNGVHHDDNIDDGNGDYGDDSPLINGVNALHVPVSVARVSMGCHIVHPGHHLLYILILIHL